MWEDICTTALAQGVGEKSPAPPRGPIGSVKWFHLDFVFNKGNALHKKYTKNKNGHETDLEMSPRPLGTTVFEEIYIRTMGK